MQFKNPTNGACSYSSGKLFYDTVFTLSSLHTNICLLVFVLRLIRNPTQESTSIEWIHAQLFLCHSSLGLGLTFSQSVLFELWCNRKKVFYLIWQFTNVVICFSQVKSYARLESELTLIFRRLLQHTTTEPKPSTSLKLNYTKKLKKVLVISFKTFDMTFTAKAHKDQVNSIVCRIYCVDIIEVLFIAKYKLHPVVSRIVLVYSKVLLV